MRRTAPRHRHVASQEVPASLRAGTAGTWISRLESCLVTPLAVGCVWRPHQGSGVYEPGMRSLHQRCVCSADHAITMPMVGCASRMSLGNVASGVGTRLVYQIQGHRHAARQEVPVSLRAGIASAMMSRRQA